MDAVKPINSIFISRVAAGSFQTQFSVKRVQALMPMLKKSNCCIHGVLQLMSKELRIGKKSLEDKNNSKNLRPRRVQITSFDVRNSNL